MYLPVSKSGLGVVMTWHSVVLVLPWVRRNFTSDLELRLDLVHIRRLGEISEIELEYTMSSKHLPEWISASVGTPPLSTRRSSYA